MTQVKFGEIRRASGYIIGQTHEGTEVVIPDEDWTIGQTHEGTEVVIPDEDWTEVDQCEDISRDLLESAIDFGNDDVFSNPALTIDIHSSPVLTIGIHSSPVLTIDIHSSPVLTIDIQTAVEILRDEGYVEYDNERQEQLKARLLIEYLCAEGIYSLKNSGVGILRDPNDLLSKGVVINWAILFELCSEKIETIIQTAEDIQSELIEKFNRMSVETDLQQRFDELYGDVYRMSNGNERAIAAGIINDDIDVPDSVAKENKSEYKKKVAQLGEYCPVVSEEVDNPLLDEYGNPKETMSQIIRELETKRRTFDYHSQQLRQQVTLIEAREIKDAIEAIGDILSELDFLSVDEQDLDAKTLREKTTTEIVLEEELDDDTPEQEEKTLGDFLSDLVATEIVLEEESDDDTPEQEEQTIGDFLSDLDLSDLDEKPKDK